MIQIFHELERPGHLCIARKNILEQHLRELMRVVHVPHSPQRTLENCFRVPVLWSLPCKDETNVPVDVHIFRRQRWRNSGPQDCCASLQEIGLASATLALVAIVQRNNDFELLGLTWHVLLALYMVILHVLCNSGLGIPYVI